MEPDLLYALLVVLIKKIPEVDAVKDVTAAVEPAVPLVLAPTWLLEVARYNFHMRLETRGSAAAAADY